MMQIHKILLPIIFGILSSLANASEVSFGFKLGQIGLDQVIEALKAKNVQYEMTEDNCENGSKKCLRKIIINDSEYLGYKARKILYFNYTNKLRISLAQIVTIASLEIRILSLCKSVKKYQTYSIRKESNLRVN